LALDHNGYNLPEELQRREDRRDKIRSLREQLEREKRGEQHLKGRSNPDHRRQRTEKASPKGMPE